MSDLLNDYQFRCLLSFKPLIDYLSRSADASRVYRTCLGEDIEQIQKQAPELFRPIEDMSVLGRHRERVERLMSLVFPPVFRESEAVAAMPGVQGLKALRVGVNLASEAISQQMRAGALG